MNSLENKPTNIQKKIEYLISIQNGKTAYKISRPKYNSQVQNNDQTSPLCTLQSLRCIIDVPPPPPRSLTVRFTHSFNYTGDVRVEIGGRS